MKFRYGLQLIAGFIFCGQLAIAQESEPSTDSNNGILQQYDQMVEKSNDYQDYKVIKKSWTANFSRNLNDSIKAYKEKETEAAEIQQQQLATIDKLKSELNASRDSLQNVIEEKNSMALVGIAVEKSSYKTIMWSCIGILLILLGVFIFKFRHSNVISSQAKENLSSVEEEFAEYKKRALEREQKLRRELQDEINKQRGV